MRLYLSSYQLGDRVQEWLALARGAARVAMIGNAQDLAEASARAVRMEQQGEALRGLGLEPEEIDLRDYFGKAQALEERLRSFELVWVRGGNVFVLKRAFEQSGFGDLVLARLAEDSLVYAGFSAGVCILGPTLRGYTRCDDPVAVPQGYDAAFSWEGLGVIPYCIAPHYRSDHPEAPLIEEEVAFMEKEGMPYKTLRDGEAIVVGGIKGLN